MPVYLIATLDTKGAEAALLRERLESFGVAVTLVDAGCTGQPSVLADVSSDEVFAAAGASRAEVAAKNDRGLAVSTAAAGVERIVADAFAAGKVEGVIGLGGSAGTTIGTRAMRALPIGLPKLMISTLASGNVRSWVGDKDILMLNSIVDIAGINRISRQILSQAAAAIAGMVQHRATSSEQSNSSQDRPLVAATMFGVTTPCVQRAREVLEAAGYEVLVFHATGNGGQAMESLIRDGVIAGVLDITTTELADELVGGILSAGPTRLTAAGERGIPQVVSVGALDMVNFGPPDTVPPKFAERKFYQHNPSVTLMRTTVVEMAKLGDEIGRKLSAAKGPRSIVLPLQGVSAIDREGQPFDDPAGRAELFRAIGRAAEGVEVVEADLHINDPAFAELAAHKLLSLIQTAGPSQATSKQASN